MFEGKHWSNCTNLGQHVNNMWAVRLARKHVNQRTYEPTTELRMAPSFITCQQSTTVSLSNEELVEFFYLRSTVQLARSFLLSGNTGVSRSGKTKRKHWVVTLTYKCFYLMVKQTGNTEWKNLSGNAVWGIYFKQNEKLMRILLHNTKRMLSLIISQMKYIDE